jgi:NTE family protein
MNKIIFRQCLYITVTVLTITGLSIFVIGCGPKYQRIAVPDVPPPVTKVHPEPRVALVLSSGGFRGGAHIGVIEVLEENDVPIDMIVGTSAGSFIGAFYADDPNIASIKQKLLHIRYETLIETSWSGVFGAPFYPTGPIRGRALQKFMLENMSARNFEDLKIRLAVVTTSLSTNTVNVIETGPIIPAVHASSALPPYFAPVNIYENTYIDGAAIAPVPVSIARSYNPQLVIAVDISKRPSLAQAENAFQITGRAMDLSFAELANRQASAADIVIRPDIVGYGPFEDEYSEEFYQAGRRAALAKLDEIKAACLKIKPRSP